MKKETKKALSSLDWAIAQSVEAPQSEDEFTAQEYAEALGITVTKARNRLQRMAFLTKRLITIKGCRTNVFRRKLDDD